MLPRYSSPICDSTESITKILDIDIGGTPRCKPDSGKVLEGNTVYLGTLAHDTLLVFSAASFFPYRMASLTGRLVGVTNA